MTLTRRPAGAGNILERNGRFTARIRIDGRLVSLDTFPTREEAERVLSAAASRLAARGNVAEGGHTLGTWAPICLDRRELAGQRDVDNDRSRYRTHVESHWLADVPLKTITTADVREWVRDLERKRTSDRRVSRPLGARTLRRCVSLLSVFFGMAIEEGLLADNPAKDIKVRRAATTSQELNYLTPAEQQAIRDCAEIREPDKLRILFAMLTGLRQNEQWCLELGDVHLDPEQPRIIVRRGSRDKTPKSKRMRSVPLIPEAVKVLRRWLELLPAYAKKNPLGLLWPTPRGSRRQKTKVYGFKGHPLAAGIARPVRWHDLRHTCASSLVSGVWGRSWRLEEVAQVLGHTSIQVTQVYAHLATSVVQDAANATPGLAIVRSDPGVIRTTLTPRRDRASGRTTEPKVVRSNRTGRARDSPG